MKDEYLYISKIKDFIGKRKCILYGFASTGRCILFEFERFGIDIAYIVDKKYELYNSQSLTSCYTKEYEIKSPYELANENIGDVAILISVDIVLAGTELPDFLSSLGFGYQRDYLYLSDMTCVTFNMVDPTLGYSRNHDERIGHAMYGKADAKYKIVTLGGSTTDPTTYLIKSWAQLLHEKLNDEDVCIYNMGMSGYDSNQELLKLIRDGMQVKPDVVISYSGYNDFVHVSSKFPDNNYPYVSLFMQNFMNNALRQNQQLEPSYGMECSKSWAKIWYDNERMMRAICTEMGIKFVGILQPCISHVGESYIYSEIEKKKLGLEDKECIEAFGQFYKEIDEMNIFSEWLVDGRDVFGTASDVFIDRCHVSEQGNSLIADYVKSILKDNF